MRALALLIAILATLPGGGGASAQEMSRAVVDASPPTALSVTVYRNPERNETDRLQQNDPRGFAMISETRTVTLPPGRSTIRFAGVSEGMVAVSAIVTGLPGGTIEKNRNADLLSPAALVDGTLGNRVTITRTNPASGEPTSETAIVRTRADGGLVLETSQGFEAVRCSGLPEKLTFDRVPPGLSASPVFKIDTAERAGGTYHITLTYLSWGFDWQAHHVATLLEDRPGGGDDVRLALTSWLTILNDNGQSFPDAELLAVAGAINVVSDFRGLADPPQARPLQLVCYPFGSTAAGSPVDYPPPPPPPPPPAMDMAAPVAVMESSQSIIVTGSRVGKVALVATEEDLGDLKLYRIPEPITVSAKGLKQVAFLDEEAVQARFLYQAACSPYDRFDRIEDVSDMEPTQILLTMKNLSERGLGAALPMGGLTLFEPSSKGDQLVAEVDMRDYAVGQDIELELGESAQVFAECARVGGADPGERDRKWVKMRAQLTNANARASSVRVMLGYGGDWEARWPRAEPYVKDGLLVVDVTVPANSTRKFDWKIRSSITD